VRFWVNKYPDLDVGRPEIQQQVVVVAAVVAVASVHSRA
jgi:hypothetical protein